MLQVNFSTSSNADFSHSQLILQQFDPWDATRAYVTGDHVEYNQGVWVAAGSSTNVTPGTDGTKWTAIARPGRDFTGCVLRMMVRADPDSVEVKIEIDSAAIGGIVIDSPATAGSFSFTLPRDRLETMPAGAYYHDLVSERPDGLIDLVWSGEITHTTGITRS